MLRGHSYSGPEHRCSPELLLLRDCLVSNIRSQKQAAPSQQFLL